ncbi:MAG: hypothetical protein CL608_24055 [Anaerolineaceae bacterium]|nr:hypothetical protein [Anaerolineaceae bacterium]
MTSEINRTRLGITFNRIARDIVDALGYVGAMVALLEEDGALPVYAFYVDPNLATIEQVHQWEDRISKVLRKPISLSDPKSARVHVNDKQYKDNLSVQAFQSKKPLVKDDLFSLFTPVIPANKLTKSIVNGVIQPALGIKEVVAVPFFLDSLNGKEPEIVGNLFAAKRTTISPQDVQVLISFGRHAAAAIEIERRRLQVLQVAKHLTTEIQTKIRKEQNMLQQIAEGVVNVLGYVGAMVATYNQDDDSLPVQAFYVDPQLATLEQIHTWENRLSTLLGKKISISDPDVAKVYINKPGYEDNLSVQAVKQFKPIVNDDLSTLFTPIVPVNKLTKPVISLVQKALKISEVIAIPFFLIAPDGGDPQIVGNLFAATRHPSGFQNEEIELLQAFGQQAAAGIFNAQLYREIDEQRQVAQVFGTMAFSASKSIHQFRNDIGFVRGHLQLLPYLEQFPEAQRNEIIASTPRAIERLDDIRDRLDQLHEPWRPVKPKPTSINTCLENARQKLAPELAFDIDVKMHLNDALPLVETSADMLTEAFSILIKNAVEAIQAARSDDGLLTISSDLADDSHILVKVEDNGSGIKEENLKNVFKMRWSTKETGLGFGLFWANDFIEGLGGKIEVESIWQEGTTFQIYLPVK